MHACNYDCMLLTYALDSLYAACSSATRTPGLNYTSLQYITTADFDTTAAVLLRLLCLCWQTSVTLLCISLVNCIPFSLMILLSKLISWPIRRSSAAHVHAPHCRVNCCVSRSREWVHCL